MSISSEAATARVCRICLGTEPPFVRPCACAGTIGDVHAVCLERWVLEQGGVQCNVCKTDYATAGPRKLRPLREWQRPSARDALRCLLAPFYVLILYLAPVSLILSMYFPSLLGSRGMTLSIVIVFCGAVAVVLVRFVRGILHECLRRGDWYMGADMMRLYITFLVVMLLLVAVSFTIASMGYYLWLSSKGDEKEEEHPRWLEWAVVTASSLIYVILALTLPCVGCAKVAHYLNRQRRIDFIDAARPPMEV